MASFGGSWGFICSEFLGGQAPGDQDSGSSRSISQRIRSFDTTVAEATHLLAPSPPLSVTIGLNMRRY
jgi:hypothetical protein